MKIRLVTLFICLCVILSGCASNSSTDMASGVSEVESSSQTEASVVPQVSASEAESEAEEARTVPEWKVLYMEFMQENFTPTTGGNNDIEIGDVDGDGVPELIYCNYFPREFTIQTIRDGKVIQPIESVLTGFVKNKATGEFVAVDSFINLRACRVLLFHTSPGEWTEYYNFSSFSSLATNEFRAGYTYNGQSHEFANAEELEAYKGMEEERALHFDETENFVKVELSKLDLSKAKFWSDAAPLINAFFDEYDGFKDNVYVEEPVVQTHWANIYKEFLSKIRYEPYGNPGDPDFFNYWRYPEDAYMGEDLSVPYALRKIYFCNSEASSQPIMLCDIIIVAPTEGWGTDGYSVENGKLVKIENFDKIFVTDYTQGYYPSLMGAEAVETFTLESEADMNTILNWLDKQARENSEIQSNPLPVGGKAWRAKVYREFLLADFCPGERFNIGEKYVGTWILDNVVNNYIIYGIGFRDTDNDGYMEMILYRSIGDSSDAEFSEYGISYEEEPYHKDIHWGIKYIGNEEILNNRNNDPDFKLPGTKYAYFDFEPNGKYDPNVMSEVLAWLESQMK